MGIILDTNAISDLFNGNHALTAMLLAHDDYFLPAIVLGEYQSGLRNSSKKGKLGANLAELISKSTVLAITANTADYYADIFDELRLIGAPIPSNDLWIAALAREHKLPLATRDGHFAKVRELKIAGW